MCNEEAKEAPAKLAYGMTDEECKRIKDAQVKSHLAPVQPQPKEKIDPKTRLHFVDMLERPPSHVANRPSDYERCIQKSYIEMQRTRSSASGQKVPSSENRKNNRCLRSTRFPIRMQEGNTRTLLENLVQLLLN
jgi:hypothetical protein